MLLARHNWVEAANHTLKGIQLAPANERPGLYVTAAGNFYNQGQHALAMHLYRTALREYRVPEIQSYLSWILATSRDDSVRNGKEALELAQEALRAQPNSPLFLNVLSGALAENGRFAEAATACDRAIANARIQGDASMVQVFQERLQILKAGKPLRY